MRLAGRRLGSAPGGAWGGYPASSPLVRCASQSCTAAAAALLPASPLPSWHGTRALPPAQKILAALAHTGPGARQRRAAHIIIVIPPGRTKKRLNRARQPQRPPPGGKATAPHRRGDGAGQGRRGAGGSASGRGRHATRLVRWSLCSDPPAPCATATAAGGCAGSLPILLDQPPGGQLAHSHGQVKGVPRPAARWIATQLGWRGAHTWHTHTLAAGASSGVRARLPAMRHAHGRACVHACMNASAGIRAGWRAFGCGGTAHWQPPFSALAHTRASPHTHAGLAAGPRAPLSPLPPPLHLKRHPHIRTPRSSCVICSLAHLHAPLPAHARDPEG